MTACRRAASGEIGLVHQGFHIPNLRQGGAEGLDHIGNLLGYACTLIQAVCRAVVAPDAEHGASRIENGVSTFEFGAVKLACLLHADLPVGVAQHPVVALVGVDELKAGVVQGGGEARL